MSLIKFKEQLLAHLPLDAMTTEQMVIIDFLDNKINEQKEEFKLNKDTGRVSFGKYRGFLIKEIIKCPSGKGTGYLEWLLCQSWFSEDKYPDLYTQIKECKIKKKVKNT